MCVYVYVYSSVKKKKCLQPVRLQGVTALIITSSTVEAEAAAISPRRWLKFLIKN